jgi:hypothetical protein
MISPKSPTKEVDLNTCMREGWMFKTGGMMSGPAKRYFRLFKDRLEYSKSQTVMLSGLYFQRP